MKGMAPLRVLVASDDEDLFGMIAKVVTTAGGALQKVSSGVHAVELLK